MFIQESIKFFSLCYKLTVIPRKFTISAVIAIFFSRSSSHGIKFQLNIVNY